MDRWDAVTGVGIVLIGVAVYLAFGLPAAIAYAGVVAVTVGLAGAVARRWPVTAKAPEGQETTKG